MSGLIRKCRAGDAFRVGEATIRIVKTGRKTVVNIIAPPEILIQHIDVSPKPPQPQTDVDTAGRY